MPLVLANRVKETTTTTGTGTVTLAGAAAGYQSFAVVGNGNTTYYTITDSASGAWEVGIGTYTASGTTLSRNTVLASSNAGALVPFGAGAKDVFVTYPSEAVLTGVTQSTSPFKTALGSNAGPSATGVNSTLVGRRAGFSLTTGAHNSFFGNDAGLVVTTGIGNSAFGALALQAATTPSSNSAFGYASLYSVTTGTDNTGFGTFSGIGLTTGSYNTGIGGYALNNMDTANDNVAVGYFSGGSIAGGKITGNKNVAVGNYSLAGFLSDFNSTSTENCAVGYAALQAAYTADYCVAVGAYALGTTGPNVQGDYNSGVGHSAGRAVTTGTQNTLIGANAGFSGTNNLTTGSNNIIVGYNAAASSATVSNETTIGNTSASTFRVPGVAFTLTGSKFTWGSNANGVATSGIAFGFAANQAGSGASNICIGDFAGRFEGGNTGGSNIFIGGAAGFGTGTSISSPFNVGIGASALQNVSGGGYNTAVGTEAGDKITTGTNNLILGYSAASSGTNDLTTGTNNTVIGYNAATSSATVSNTVTLGNSSITTLRCQVTTITGLSDARDKANIGDLPAGLNFVKALRPVEFDWNMRDGGKVGVYDTGFIAQDLKAAQEATGVNIPGLVFEDNPDRLEAGYGKLIPVLVKAIQELNAKVEALEAQLKGN